MPISCSAISTPHASPVAACRWTARRGRRRLGRLAQALGISVAQAAWGIHDVVTEAMASAARTHLAERGRDASELHARLYRRRRAGAWLPPRAQARHPAHHRAARGGRRLGPRPAHRAAAGGPRGHPRAGGCCIGPPPRWRPHSPRWRPRPAPCWRGGWADDAPPPERVVDARCLGQGAHMPVTLPPTPWPSEDAALHAMMRRGLRRRLSGALPPPATRRAD
jgi:N-methylhydantoinase A